MSDREKRLHRKPWTQMPGPVELKLRHEIVAHLHAYGSRRYELLREHPDFRDHIGLHLGETGRKRLTRLVADVRRTAPGARRKRSAMETNMREPDAGTPVKPARPIIVPAVAANVRTGAIHVSYGELRLLIEEQLPILRAGMHACLGADGEMVDHATYLKFSQEHRAVLEQSIRLTDRLQAQLNSDRFAASLMRLAEGLADSPERLAAFHADVATAAAECGGLIPDKGVHQ